MKAIGLTLTSLFNLWLAALIARISGRLQATLAGDRADGLSAVRADRARDRGRAERSCPT